MFSYNHILSRGEKWDELGLYKFGYVPSHGGWHLLRCGEMVEILFCLTSPDICAPIWVCTPWDIAAPAPFLMRSEAIWRLGRTWFQHNPIITRD